MPNYRRANVPGAIYFFTVVTFERRKFLTNPEARECLKKAFTATWRSAPFDNIAFVLLPDHIHTLCQLPEGDSDFPGRWSRFKSTFSRLYSEGEVVSGDQNPSRMQKRERHIWQRRYWEHLIRDEEELKQHLDYIHYNPVKHGYVESTREWAWSSYGRYLRMGWYEADLGKY